MHPFLERQLERPAGQKVIFWVASLAIIIFVFWQFIYSNKVQELNDLKSRVERLTTEINHERRLAQNLNKFRDQVKELDIKLKELLHELPDKREIPDLLASVSSLAREAGLEVSLFRPMAERYKAFYAQVPVEVSVEGTFHQVATFFDEVGRLSRIVNIDGITLRDPQISDEKVVVKSDCVATTFRYLEESERMTAAGREGEVKKRRKKS